MDSCKGKVGQDPRMTNQPRQRSLVRRMPVSNGGQLIATHRNSGILINRRGNIVDWVCDLEQKQIVIVRIRVQIETRISKLSFYC